MSKSKSWAKPGQGNRHQQGYGSVWDRLRQQVLKRDRHLCVACWKRGRPTPAQEVDHIVPRARGGTDDMVNLQSLCHDCHREKTIKDKGGRPRPAFDEQGFPIED